ncbi:MAG: HAMP domain-containing sensor histidine kinase [Actinomycetes bacterium]
MIRLRHPGTAARLSGYLALLLAVILGVSAWVTWLSFSRRSTDQATTALSAQLSALNRSAAGRGSTTTSDWAVRYLSGAALPSGQRMIIWLPGGVRFGSADAKALLRDPTVRRLMSSPPAVTHSATIHTALGPARVLTSPILEGGTTVGSVLVSYDLSASESDQRRVLALAAFEAVVGLVAAVAGTYLLLRRLLGTIRRITTTARTIEEGDLDHRLGEQVGGEEVAELAATLDLMLDRIDSVMAVQRRLLSDVSHQLKTPMTVMRGHLEVLDRTGIDNPTEVRHTLDVVLGELDHMRVLIDQLLLLGSALEPDLASLGPVDLRAFMGDLAAAAEVLGDRRVELGRVPDVVIIVDEAKLRGAILNLVDNAVRATGDDDVIELGVLHDGSGEISLQVADSGPGIAPLDRPKVLERFGRPDTETRSGSGLGLAIVATVAEAHGGRLELGTSSHGGLCASIVLPGSVVMSVSAFEEA